MVQTTRRFCRSALGFVNLGALYEHPNYNATGFIAIKTNLDVKKYRKFIVKGVKEPLSNVPFHKNTSIKRLSMLGKNKIPQSKIHTAVHFVNANENKISQYSELHRHNANEINLIISEDEKLTYEIQLGDEKYIVSSPATIFIPKGVKHSAEVKSGKGIFVCIILSNNYKSY